MMSDLVFARQRKTVFMSGQKGWDAAMNWVLCGDTSQYYNTSTKRNWAKDSCRPGALCSFEFLKNEDSLNTRRAAALGWTPKRRHCPGWILEEVLSLRWSPACARQAYRERTSSVRLQDNTVVRSFRRNSGARICLGGRLSSIRFDSSDSLFLVRWFVCANGKVACIGPRRNQY